MNSANTLSPLQQEKFRFNLGIAAMCAVVIMVFIMGLVKIYSPDLGFHLKSAKWMLDNKQFIYTDTFSYASAGNNYYNLQWLYQLFIYFLYSRGQSVLVIANALLITISILLASLRFLNYKETGDSKIKLGLFALMAILFVQPLSVEIRPHVFSWIFLNLFLYFLEVYKNENKKIIFVLPILMVLWVNSHSLAILGLVTMIIYNAGIYLEKGELDKKLLLYTGFTLAAFLVNPYFINGLFYPIKQLGIISGSNQLKNYIGEFQSPFTANEIKMLGPGYFTSPLLIIHLAAAFSLFSIVRSLLLKNFTNALLLAAYFFLLYLAHKNYGYFIMISLPLFVKYFLNWLESKRKNKTGGKVLPIDKKKSKVVQMHEMYPIAETHQLLFRRVALIAVIISVFISITTVTNGYQVFRKSPLRFGREINTDELPVGATNFLNKNRVKGKLLNHLDFGGYLMQHYDEKVFIDGRLETISEEVFEEYYRSLTIRNGIKQMVQDYNPDIIVFPYLKASYWWDYFVSSKKSSGYKPVYFDGLSVIYLRTSSFPQIPELNDNNTLPVNDTAAGERISRYFHSAKSKGLMVLLNGLWKKQIFSVADQNKASFCFGNGFYKSALGYSVIGIETSTVHSPNIFKNLSIYYRENNMPNEAQLCEENSQ